MSDKPFNDHNECSDFHLAPLRDIRQEPGHTCGLHVALDLGINLEDCRCFSLINTEPLPDTDYNPRSL